MSMWLSRKLRGALLLVPLMAISASRGQAQSVLSDAPAAIVPDARTSPDGAQADPAPVAGSKTRASSSPYLYGPVTRMNSKHDKLEFQLSQRDGIRVGALLPVRQLNGSGKLTGEVEVHLVDANQAVARVKSGSVNVGDEVVFQRPVASAPANVHDLRYLTAEITFANPAPGSTRRTYHGRILEATWSGPFDISEIHVELLVDRQNFVLRYPASALRQMKVNGMLMISDPSKQTLISAEILALRERVREDSKRLQELRLTEVQAGERVRMAEVPHRQYDQHSLSAAIAAREQAQRDAAAWRYQAQAAMAAAAREQAQPQADAFAYQALTASATPAPQPIPRNDETWNFEVPTRTQNSDADWRPVQPNDPTWSFASDSAPDSPSRSSPLTLSRGLQMARGLLSAGAAAQEFRDSSEVTDKLRSAADVAGGVLEVWKALDDE